MVCSCGGIFLWEVTVAAAAAVISFFGCDAMAILVSCASLTSLAEADKLCRYGALL